MMLHKPAVRLIFLLSAFLLVLSAPYSQAQKTKWNKVRILFYTKNGQGYVHDNIPNSIQAIRELSKEYGFKVDATEDPAVFTDDNLKQYDAIVFSNTNN